MEIAMKSGACLVRSGGAGTLDIARDELRWFHRWGAADCGLHAQAYERAPSGTRQADRTTNHQMAAYAKQRRVWRALGKLDAERLATLRLAFSGHGGRDRVVALALHDVTELVLADRATRDAWGRHEEARLRAGTNKTTRRSFDEWLVQACRDGLPALMRLRDKHEAVLVEAIAAYVAVREWPTKRERVDRPTRRGPYRVKSVAEILREDSQTFGEYQGGTP